MDVALLVVPNDGFVVITSTVGLNIDAEGAVYLQLESAGHRHELMLSRGIASC